MSLYLPDTSFAAADNRLIADTVVNGLSGMVDIEESGGREQRRIRMPPKGRRTLAIDTYLLTQTARRLLRDFIVQVNFTYTPFYAFDPVQEAYLAVNLYGWNTVANSNTPPALGNGSTTMFTLAFGNPSLRASWNSTIAAVYADGVSKTFSQALNAGPGSEDQITFTGGFTPANGQVLTCDITGRPRIPMRFQAAQQLEQWMRGAAFATTRHLDLIEVLNEVV